MIVRGVDRILPVVGLEIHVQLATRTKMFCRCPNRFGDPPNSNVCPVCLGLPGAMPVPNREAVERTIRVGLALEATIAGVTKWDRKAYYYPDLPKNYQISQYDEPICTDGRLEVSGDGGERRVIRIRRAHLEEDAGKNIHDNPAHTGVDLNRAGTPLLEIVSEPDLNSAEEVLEYARTMQRIVRWLGASEANMEMGQMRFEPNINLRIDSGGRVTTTPIVEVKNLNSFRALEGAVTHEIDRQYEEWLDDPEGFTLERLGKQNRGFDADRGVTVFQREKEEAHDYRYFPEPDLAPVAISGEWRERLAATIGELPRRRQARYREELALSERNAEALTAERETGDLFDAAVGMGADAEKTANLLVGKASQLANQRGCTLAALGIGAARLAGLAGMLTGGEINATTAARILELLVDDPRSPEAIARQEGLLMETDPEAIGRWVDEAVEANPQAREDAQSDGKSRKKAFGFLMGQVMQRSKGTAPPQEVQRLLRARLGLDGDGGGGDGGASTSAR